MAMHELSSPQNMRLHRVRQYVYYPIRHIGFCQSRYLCPLILSVYTVRPVLGSLASCASVTLYSCLKICLLASTTQS